MLRTAIAASLMLASVSAPAFAADAPAAPAAAGRYTVADTDIGTLVDDPESKAIIDKHIPGFSDNPQLQMARGFTLKALQGFVPDQMTDELLAKIEADLAKLPKK